MPTYSVINKVTGEKMTFIKTMKEYSEWRDANPDWDKDWQAGVAGTTYGTPKADNGFKEVMSKVQKAHPGANLSRFT
tara:strand:- start:242 stop:472 length:231 start_codon:yes stop_codon:yes gene_type:complete